MDSSVVAALVAVVVIVPLSAVLALWIVFRLRQKSDQHMPPAVAGTLTVPVRRLQRTSGILWSTSNSISPRLAITREELEFKIFKPDFWPFSEISEVKLAPSPFMTRLVIRNRNGIRLYANLAGKAQARGVLLALPQEVPLGRRARDLREGSGS